MSWKILPSGINPENAQALGKERSALEQIVGTIDKLDQGLEDVAGLVELAIEAEDEDTFHEAQAELGRPRIYSWPSSEFRRMFSGKSDPARLLSGYSIWFWWY